MNHEPHYTSASRGGFDKEPVSPGPTKRAEHYEIADQMVSNILGFSPEIQNEMVAHIKNQISNHRKMQLEKMDKEMAFLKDCLHALHN